MTKKKSKPKPAPKLTEKHPPTIIRKVADQTVTATPYIEPISKPTDRIRDVGFRFGFRFKTRDEQK